MTGSPVVLTYSVVGCARCGGDGHDDLPFWAFKIPVTAGGYRFTHWATCPVTGDPILMTMTAPEVAA